MLNRELNIRFHFYITLSLSFLLPIYPPVLPVVIILLVINWLAGGNFMRLFRKNLHTPYLLLFISLYLLYLIGLTYSENLTYGLKDLETKLSLLIFPLIYFSSEKLNVQQMQSVFKALIYGCVAAAVICIGHAFYQYFMVKYTLSQGIWAWNYGINFFLKSRLSVWIHPSYRSMYFALALAVIYLFRKKELFSGQKKYFIFLFLAICVLLFNSKAGILSLMVLGAHIMWQLVFKEKRIKLAVGGTAVSVLLFISLYFAAPQFTIRINSVFTSFSANVDVKKSEESTASRIALWQAAKVVITQNWLTGTGTGDVKDELMNEYKREEMIFALQEKLNAHNQFLQTFAALGIAGFISLSASVLIPLFREWKKSNYIYVVFMLIILLNLLAESMFETQAGVVFYAFFNSLLLFSYQKNYDTILPTQDHR